MGTGIMGAIPLSFRFESGTWEGDEQRYKEMFIKHAPKDFFDFYNEKQQKETTGNKEKTMTYYVIKPDLLIPNFKDFFFEFHKLLDTPPELFNGDNFNDKYDAVVASNDLEKFIAYFEGCSGDAPRIFPYFETMYITKCVNLLVYQGSYKAILEEWSTLSDMESLLWAAMKHPLAKVMRFGMST
jgi:hypothetical protein